MLAAYGAVMWKLRGSTVGGIVFDLRVVRLDGRAVDWETAIIRALSCFLSLAVAGLGFIWIAFDANSQAWHDKIAGHRGGARGEGRAPGIIGGMISRRTSLGVKVGAVTIGGKAPIVVQSMTNTDTADIDGTVAQVKALARAGSELVRITVNNDESAAAVPHIRERLDAHGHQHAPGGRFSLQRPQTAQGASGLRSRRSANCASIRATSAAAASAIRNSRK